MYRNGHEYNKMAELVGQIYIDYEITTFPINPSEICQKLGIKQIKYSEFDLEDRELLLWQSLSGFYVPPTNRSEPMIFYNDNVNQVGSVGNMNRNILHEVRHYLCEDNDEFPEDDDLADYFAKYFMAPIPYLIEKGIDDEKEIETVFNVDPAMAHSISNNIKNRKQYYGIKIFDYEKPILRQLLGAEYKY